MADLYNVQTISSGGSETIVEKQRDEKTQMLIEDNNVINGLTKDV